MAETSARVKVSRVFVPGGRPTITYVPRTELHLERRLQSYLDERHKVLSVSGPTKTGKTVLLKSQLSGAIWLSGGSIETVAEFWTALADALGVHSETGLDGELSHTESDSASAGLSAGITAGYQGGEAITRGRTQVTRQVHTPKDGARRRLLADPNQVVVVDDFHYIPQLVQLQIVRGVKDLIFEGVGFIVAAVPHRAYDFVKVEKEMTGRVIQLDIGFWDTSDLSEIAVRGFEALNLTASERVINRLASEAFGSPHLMQEICLELCKDNGISAMQKYPATLQRPDWSSFFSSIAPGTSKIAFDVLSRGAPQGRDRKVRELRDGTSTDVYGAVLMAIAQTGPLTSMTYEKLRGALKEVLSEDVLQKHEVVRVLEELSRIARDEIAGEPVVDWDGEMSTLHISDPYFAFWLRHGSHIPTS